MPEVHMKYSDFLNSVADEIEFELIADVILRLKFNQDEKTLVMSMADKITDNSELHGSLDLERLNTLIKTLTIIRNQIKQN